MAELYLISHSHEADKALIDTSARETVQALVTVTDTELDFILLIE